jgi:hypothetical protein
LKILLDRRRRQSWLTLPRRAGVAKARCTYFEAQERLFRDVVRAAITECDKSPYLMRPAAVSALVMAAPTSIPRYRA